MTQLFKDTVPHVPYFLSQYRNKTEGHGQVREVNGDPPSPWRSSILDIYHIYKAAADAVEG